MRELLTVIDYSKAEEVGDVPERVRQQLKEVWDWARQEASKVGQKGLGSLERNLREKMLQMGGSILEASLIEKCGTGYLGSRPKRYRSSSDTSALA